MADANEEIVRQYLEQKGFFVRANVPYKRSKEDTGKHSSGYGDIDLLAWHPNGTRYLLEVKGWHTEDITPSYFVQGDPYIDTLMRRAATDVFRSSAFKTVLVIPSIGSRSKRVVQEKARNEGIDELWEFGDILRWLLKNTGVQQNQRSEVLQMLRLVNAYGLSAEPQPR
jgi:hypothetical protein